MAGSRALPGLPTRERRPEWCPHSLVRHQRTNFEGINFFSAAIKAEGPPGWWPNCPSFWPSESSTITVEKPRTPWDEIGLGTRRLARSRVDLRKNGMREMRRVGPTEYWRKMFGRLATFRSRYGHCRVPETHSPELCSWVERQRRFRDRLNREQRAALNLLDFDWCPYVTQWERSFQELVAFKKRFGHCRVTARWRENPSLGDWVFRQRNETERLTPKKRARLKKLGFEWNPLRSHWKRRFAQAKAFKAKHESLAGLFNANQALYKWVRREYAGRRKLTIVQRRCMEKLVGKQVSNKEQWRQRFTQLKAHHRRHGGLKRLRRNNMRLYVWMHFQKSKMRQGRLRPEQIRRLRSIGIFNEMVRGRAVRKSRDFVAQEESGQAPHSAFSEKSRPVRRR